MENSPHFQSDSEVNEAKAGAAEKKPDNDEKDKKSKQKSEVRHVPLVKVEVAPSPSKEEDLKPRPKLSITDRLLESIGAKPIKEAADARAKEELTPEGETPQSTEAEDQPLATEVASGEVSDVNVVPIEAADWKTEDNPITISGPAPERSSSGEVAPEPIGNTEEFAEVSPAPEIGGEAPEVETEPVEPELLEEGLGSEGPPEPPEDDPPAPEPSGYGPGPRPPISVGGGGIVSSAESPWYDAAAVEREHQQALKDAEYRGRSVGIRKGLGTGLLFGWLVGRHGKKKQAREFEKRLKQRDKEIKGLKTEHTAAGERLEAVKRTQEQLRSNIAAQGVKAPRQPANVLKRPSEVHEPLPTVVKAPQRTSEGDPSMVTASYEKPRSSEAPRRLTEVIFAPASRAERGAVAVEQTMNNEKVTELQEVTEQTYQVEAGHRVETSAWHRIEIDEKTGKPVENPNVAYGEEFRHEQRQEVLPDDATTNNRNSGDAKTAKSKGTAPLGGGGSAAQLGGLAAASFAQATALGSQSKQQTGLSGSPAVVAVEKRDEDSGVLRFASNPFVWAAAVMIVVILLIVGILQ